MSKWSKYRPIQILVLGFALVLFVLGLIVWLGIRQAESIRQMAASLAQEHRLTASLVDGLEREQQRAGALLIQTVRGVADPQRKAQLLQEVAAFSQALPPLIQDGRQALPAQNWEQFEKAVTQFSAAVRAALMGAEISEDVAAQLEQKYDALLHASDQVIKQDSIRAAELENRIEVTSVALVTRTGWLLCLCLVLALVCAGATVQLMLRALRHFAWQREEMNRVSWHLIQGQEESARRFSHEMHDELGQSLTALKAMIAAISPAELPSRRADCLQLLDEAIGNVRELSQLLRPVILDDFGLSAALRWLADRFQERTRIQVKVLSNVNLRFADQIETHLFRITQEALTNVARHSNATKVQITLQQERDQLLLVISDNGIGLPSKQNRAASLGLIGMRARTEQIDGSFSLKNNPNGGVIVQVCAPVSARL